MSTLYKMNTFLRHNNFNTHHEEGTNQVVEIHQSYARSNLHHKSMNKQ